MIDGVPPAVTSIYDVEKRRPSLNERDTRLHQLFSLWPIRFWELLQKLLSLLFLSGLYLPLHRIDLPLRAPPFCAGPHTQDPRSVRKPDANRLVLRWLNVIVTVDVPCP